LSVLDAETGKPLRTVEEGEVGDVAFSSDGKMIVAWVIKSGVKRWEVTKLVK
jgi:hypothetical protein